MGKGEPTDYLTAMQAFATRVDLGSYSQRAPPKGDPEVFIISRCISSPEADLSTAPAFPLLVLPFGYLVNRAAAHH